ncbi:MAG: LpxD N-terminal domain-containing protein, partial [Thermosynechococcaceae cyanobacterium]
MKFQALAQRLGIPDEQTSLVQIPTLNPELTGVSSIDTAQSGTIAFIEGRALATRISETSASALILPQHSALLGAATQQGIAWMATDQPRLLFAKALALFYQPWQREAGIHPTAVIDPSVQLGQGVAIGAYTTVQAGVVLGDGVCLHDQVAIYPHVCVGDRTVIHAHATLHERSQIGKD